MKILVSQKLPSNLTPYEEITKKYGAKFEFRPFFLIEPLSVKEFRTQKINLADYTAIVFSSRHAIDAYFALCEELRVKIKDDTKYFCTTELVANYLQKHIVYRKRKIFYGDGTPESIVALIGPKHKGEKFLVTTSDTASAERVCSLFAVAGLEYDAAVIVKSVSQDIKDLKISDYGIITCINPYDVKSLFENFPDFVQGDTKFIAYGKNILSAMKEAGLEVAATGPTPEAPSVAKTIELYLAKNKK